tara:strand:+ start:241 stop:756 length:516 start_codon:yes stop_codon:yes gene_type:complete
MTQGKRYGPKGYIPKFEKGIQNTTKSVEVPTPKPSIPETPTSKPFTNPIKRAINKIPSKLKGMVTTSVDKTKTMEKAEMPDKFKKKIAMRKIKNVAKDVFNKKDGGKTIPEGPEGAGLRALKAEAPEVVSEMGYKKKGGIVEGINNIKGMKNGGVCRGMGAATKGGSFNVS